MYQRTNARDAEPPPKVRCNAMMQPPPRALHQSRSHVRENDREYESDRERMKETRR